MGMLAAVKDMGELVKKVHDASLQTEMQQKIIDVQNECLALQEKLGELQGENTSLNSQVEKLQKRADRRKQMSIVNGCYRIHDDLGERAICGNCYEKHGTTMPLRDLCDSSGFCDTCDTAFNNAYPR